MSGDYEAVSSVNDSTFAASIVEISRRRKVTQRLFLTVENGLGLDYRTIEQQVQPSAIAGRA